MNTMAKFLSVRRYFASVVDRNEYACGVVPVSIRLTSLKGFPA